MDIILANSEYDDVKYLTADIDVDIGGSNDFELKILRDDYDAEIKPGAIIYIPDTEYGGIIGEEKTDTSLDTLSYYGRSWRGILDKKIIEPPSGSAYRTVSGDLQQIVKDLIEEHFSELFIVPDEAIEITVSNYQFDRYCTLLSGISKMLGDNGCRLNLQYVQTQDGGYVECRVEVMIDHSDEIELSQDSRLNFKMSKISNGVNHLICLGKGELAEREVIHLYVQGDGSIGNSIYYTDIEEVADIYDYSSAESSDELRNGGIKRLRELMNSSSFEMDVASLDIDVPLGDVVGGRDYTTGISMIQPIGEKIFRIEAGTESIEYKLQSEPFVLRPAVGNFLTSLNEDFEDADESIFIVR